jgi:hypothetical protein
MPEPDIERREFELSLAIFSVAAALIGVCLTGIGLLQVLHGLNRISTLGDELLAIDAVLFLVACVMAFLSFRTHHNHRRMLLRKVSDVVFLVGLGLLAAVSGLLSFAFLR